MYSLTPLLLSDPAQSTDASYPFFPPLHWYTAEGPLCSPVLMQTWGGLLFAFLNLFYKVSLYIPTLTSSHPLLLKVELILLC